MKYLYLITLILVVFTYDVIRAQEINFPGGIDSLSTYIQQALKYPENARNSCIQGTVKISFNVDSSGSVLDPKIVEGVEYGEELDQEALRIVQTLPTFNRHQGAEKQVILPIKFEIPDRKEPEFPGGKQALEKFLKKNIHYRQTGKGIEKDVLISFQVDETGTLHKIAVLKSISPGIDEEALRVVKMMPKWLPGTKDCFPVLMEYILPITFKS